MRMITHAPLALLVAGFALASCGKSDQTAQATPPSSASNAAPATSTTPAQATAPAASASASTTEPSYPAAIPDPYASQTFSDPRLQQGHDVFQKWCAPCHAPGPYHPGTQALAAKYKGEKPDALEARTDLTPDVTKTFVRGGVSIMPPFRKTEITDQELDALAAYLARPH